MQTKRICGATLFRCVLVVALATLLLLCRTVDNGLVALELSTGELNLSNLSSVSSRSSAAGASQSGPALGPPPHKLRHKHNATAPQPQRQWEVPRSHGRKTPFRWPQDDVGAGHGEVTDVEVGLAPASESVRVLARPSTSDGARGAVDVQIFVTPHGVDCALVVPRTDKPPRPGEPSRTASSACRYRWYLRGQQLLGGDYLVALNETTYWSGALVYEPADAYVVEVTRDVPRVAQGHMADFDIVSECNRRINFDSGASRRSREEKERGSQDSDSRRRSWKDVPECRLASSSSCDWADGAWELGSAESALPLRNLSDADTTFLEVDNANAANKNAKPYVWVPRHCRLARLHKDALLAARGKFGNRKLDFVFLGTSRLRHAAEALSTWTGRASPFDPGHARWTQGGTDELRVFFSFNSYRPLIAQNRLPPGTPKPKYPILNSDFDIDCLRNGMDRAGLVGSPTVAADADERDLVVVISLGIWESNGFQHNSDEQFRAYMAGILSYVAARAPRATLLYVTDPAFHLWREATPAVLPKGEAFRFGMLEHYKGSFHDIAPMYLNATRFQEFTAAARLELAAAHPRWRLVDYFAVTQANRLASSDGVHYSPGLRNQLVQAIANALMPA